MFKKVPQKLNRSENEQIPDEKTNVLICGLFKSTTTKASVHLGPSYNDNLVAYRNINFEELKTLLDIKHSLILEHAFEILNVFHDRMDTFSTDEIYLSTWQSNQVGESQGTRILRHRSLSWKNIQTYRRKCKMERSTSRLPTVQHIQRIIWNRWRTNWVRVEYFPWTYNVGNPSKDSRQTGSLSNKSGRISRSNHLHVHVQRNWLDRERKFYRKFFEFRQRSRITQEGFQLGHWSFLGSKEEEKWYGTNTYAKKDSGIKPRMSCSENIKESEHPIFRGSSALNGGFLKRQGGRCAMHFNAESSNTELFFRTIHSASQFSIHGAVASWCEELTHLIPGQTYWSMERSVAKVNDQLSQKLEPQELDSLVQTPRRMIKQRETACVIIIKDLKKCRMRSKSRQPAHLRDSWGESQSECIAKLFTIWLMVWGARQEHAERIHYLVIIKIPNLLNGSVDTPKWVQFFKSKLCVALINTELKYRYRQHQETDPHPGLSCPEAQTATWWS